MSECSASTDAGHSPNGTAMRLHAKVLGEAHSNTILFIPGMAGSHRAWNEDFQALSARFRLVMLDSLGFGHSPKPDISYSVDDHVDAIHETVRALALGRVHVVGHSIGCLLGLAYANRHPRAVSKLALLALPLFQDEAQARATIRNVSLLHRWFVMDTALAKMAGLALHSGQSLLMRLAPRLVSTVPAAVAQDALLHTWKSYSGTLRNVLFRADANSWLQTLDQPLLLIHGDGDTTAPCTNVERAAVALPNAVLIKLTADHGLIYTHSKVIATQLAQFFCAWS